MHVPCVDSRATGCRLAHVALLRTMTIMHCHGMYVDAAEMMRAGLISEMMDDMIEDAVGSDEIEEDADAEVDKVLMELAGETMAQLATASAPRPQVCLSVLWGYGACMQLLQRVKHVWYNAMVATMMCLTHHGMTACILRTQMSSLILVVIVSGHSLPTSPLEAWLKIVSSIVWCHAAML